MAGNQQGHRPRPTIVRALPVLIVLLLAVGCGADDEQPLAAEAPQDTSSTTESPAADHPDDGIALSVTLWHCGIEPVTVDGRQWEVPDTETVDGHPDLPLDATNTPSDWVGSGTAVVRGDAMTYLFPSVDSPTITTMFLLMKTGRNGGFIMYMILPSSMMENTFMPTVQMPLMGM